MYSPHKFADRVGNIGKALPDPFPVFGHAEARFRKGAVSMIAGTPGSFKSVLALNMLVLWARKGIRGLYFCADSDEFTVTKRLAGIITGENLNLVEGRLIGSDRARWLKRYSQVIQGEFEDPETGTSRVQFEYEQMRGAEAIATHLKSWEQVYGGYPDVVFIDNLTDFVSSPLAFDEMHELLGALDGISKEVKAHVCVLHHARLQNGGKNDDDDRPKGSPPPDWQIAGRMTQKPRMAITIAATGLTVQMAVVKNSLGPQDRDAQTVYRLAVTRSMQMREFSGGRYGPGTAA